MRSIKKQKLLNAFPKLSSVSLYCIRRDVQLWLTIDDVVRKILVQSIANELIHEVRIQEKSQSFFHKIGRKLRDISPHRGKRRRTTVSEQQSRA